MFLFCSFMLKSLLRTSKLILCVFLSTSVSYSPKPPPSDSSSSLMVGNYSTDTNFDFFLLWIITPPFP